MAAALLTSAMVMPAAAADITIKNFVGQIDIIQGDDGVSVLDAGTKGGLDYSDSRGNIHIDGGLSRKERNKVCNGNGISFDLDWNGKRHTGDTRLKDYPELRISVPNGSNLIIRDSALYLDSQSHLGDADLDVQGCFDMKIDSAETLKLDKSGSGDIEIGRADSVDIEKSGSGDVELGRTARFNLEQSGSGDIEVDRVDGPVTIDKSGSGDIEIGEIDGDFEIDKSGAGDVEVNDGTVPSLRVNNSGSGDVDIDAAVGDAVVRASGSSDVYVKSVSGRVDVSTSGSSDFTRGDD